jgi:hypothetical protein
MYGHHAGHGIEGTEEVCQSSCMWQTKMLCCDVVREGGSWSERTRTWTSLLVAHGYPAWQTAALAECGGTVLHYGCMTPVSAAHGQGQCQVHLGACGRWNGVRENVPG